MTETPHTEEPSKASRLKASRVLSTVKALQVRISERFPDAGLNKVCAELERVCRASQQRVDWIAQPIWPLRILNYGLVAGVVAVLVAALLGVRSELEEQSLSMIGWIQAIEPAINEVIWVSLAIFFIWTLEGRIKRKRALRALHELRSIAHVIDMHQLDKDPDRLLKNRPNTKSSPKSAMNAFSLRRYLDYCSEMLSLTGKVAALHLETLDDATVVTAVNEIEELTTGLSRKLWQKIDLVSRGMENDIYSEEE